MTSSTSVTRMSDDEEWGDSAADPDADWGDADADAEGDVDAEGGWGDDDIKDSADTSGWDDAQPSASSSLPPDDSELPSLSRQASYRILDNESLLATQNKLIAQNAEVLFVTAPEAGLLLRHYGWKSKKLQGEWFENQKKVRETVGITAAEEGRRTVPSGRVQCQSAYCDEVDVADAYALNCGHWFCKDCWAAYLASQINDGQRSIFTKCMGMRCQLEHAHKFGCACSELVPESVFSRFVADKRLLDKYRRWLLDSFVEGQKSIKWCSRPGCTYCVSYPSGGTKAIQCLCGYNFCFSCMEEAHTPAPCDLVKKWLLREKSDDATAIWLAAKTKECPKCQVRIEKNKACNHMTCVKCGHNCQRAAQHTPAATVLRLVAPRTMSLTIVVLLSYGSAQSAGCAKDPGPRTATKPAATMSDHTQTFARQASPRSSISHLCATASPDTFRVFLRSPPGVLQVRRRGEGGQGVF